MDKYFYRKLNKPTSQQSLYNLRTVSLPNETNDKNKNLSLKKKLPCRIDKINLFIDLKSIKDENNFEDDSILENSKNFY